MASRAQSEVFKPNIIFWKVLGMWPENGSSRIYNVYCVIYRALFCFVWLFLYTLSIIFTPMNLEVMITQLMFYFSDIAGRCKMLTIVYKHKHIVKTLEILDSKEFLGTEKIPCEIIEKNKAFYQKYRIACSSFYCFGLILMILVPLVEYWIRTGADLDLPVCEYYFLSDVKREKVFKVAFIYQFLGVGILILCNGAVDTLICGFIMIALTQFKVLNWKMKNLMLSGPDQLNDPEEQEVILNNRLTECIKHHQVILKFCEAVQEILSVPLFMQFGTGAITICVSMCSFLQPMARRDLMFMGCYTLAMMLEIFYPALLGSQLTKESENLVFSAYRSDWIPRSKSFKSSLRLMVERAKRPLVLTGMKMFQVSVTTFASILKTAYSFFTLLQCVLEDKEQ